VGADGDVVLVDLKKETRVDSSRFFSKARFSPFDGVLTRGAVRSTIVNGTLVYHDGAIIAGEGSGRVLRRSAS
jgi:dihydroorotase-like cyclic amidohydrolase